VLVEIFPDLVLVIRVQAKPVSPNLKKILSFFEKPFKVIGYRNFPSEKNCWQVM
jgi:hypothetical protein